MMRRLPPPLIDIKQQSRLSPQSTQATVATIQNSRIGVNIGDTGRFNIGVFDATGDWNLSFRWPQDPGTSFTSLRIDGQDYLYGNGIGSGYDPAPGGTQVMAPTNYGSTTNRSVWMINGIEVQQELQIVANPQTGQQDVVRIAYRLHNTSANAKNVGMRMMIDTMINNDDGAVFRTPTEGLLKAEREYVGSAIPTTVQVIPAINDVTHVAAITLQGGDATLPDVLSFADWPSIKLTPYNYTTTNISFNPPDGDSAYALYWYPTSLKADEYRSYVTYYGLSSITTNLLPPLALGVTSPASIVYKNGGYFPNPFEVTAIVKNVGSGTANSAQVQLILPAGLQLVNGTATQSLGDLAVNQEKQVAWQVQVSSSQTTPRNLTLSITASASNAAAKTVTRPLAIAAAPTAPNPPPYTTSRYVTSRDPKTLNTMGCNAAQASSGLIALFWGKPKFVAGVYGTNNIDGNVVPLFTSITDIENLTKKWIDGFWRCKTSNSNITLAISTNNFDLDSLPIGIPSSHGQEWGKLINRLDQYVKTNNYGSALTIYGGSDIEQKVADGWSPANKTIEWVDGYASATNRTFYNFGEFSGPSHQYPTWDLQLGWSLEDTWYVSWHGNNQPVPLIYNTAGTNASQWGYLAEWAKIHKNSDMTFMGTMTQMQACATNPPCNGTDNTPNTGWQQLWLELNSYDATIQSVLKWSTDASWKQE